MTLRRGGQKGECHEGREEGWREEGRRWGERERERERGEKGDGRKVITEETEIRWEKIKKQKRRRGERKSRARTQEDR